MDSVKCKYLVDDATNLKQSDKTTGESVCEIKMFKEMFPSFTPAVQTVNRNRKPYLF